MWIETKISFCLCLSFSSLLLVCLDAVAEHTCVNIQKNVLVHTWFILFTTIMIYRYRPYRFLVRNSHPHTHEKLCRCHLIAKPSQLFDNYLLVIYLSQSAVDAYTNTYCRIRFGWCLCDGRIMLFGDGKSQNSNHTCVFAIETFFLWS